MSDAMTAWAKAWLDRREKSKALDAAVSAALKASAAEVQGARMKRKKKVHPKDRITEQHLAQARWMRSRGESWDSIAASLNVHRQGLCRILERGWTKATETSAARTRVRQLRASGQSWASIAKSEGMTLAQARYAARSK